MKRITTPTSFQGRRSFLQPGKIRHTGKGLCKLFALPGMQIYGKKAKTRVLLTHYLSLFERTGQSCVPVLSGILQRFNIERSSQLPARRPETPVYDLQHFQADTPLQKEFQCFRFRIRIPSIKEKFQYLRKLQWFLRIEMNSQPHVFLSTEKSKMTAHWHGPL